MGDGLIYTLYLFPKEFQVAKVCVERSTGNRMEGERKTKVEAQNGIGTKATDTEELGDLKIRYSWVSSVALSSSP